MNNKLKNLKKISRISGITLVALVVTIVVLLILAGITITYMMGENSIFRRASDAKEQTAIAKAREKLEIVLADAVIEKHTNAEYNQNDFLDDMILTRIQKSEIQGDIAIVDGYAFELDRSAPKIGTYLGKKEDLEFPEVSIDAPVLSLDNKTATFTITAREEKNGISKIEVWQKGQRIEEFTYSNVTDTITQPCTVKRNGTYTVKAYSKLTGTARTKVEGIVMAVEFSPSGDENYKKEHSTTIKVKETGDTVKSLKYQWTKEITEPEESSFDGAKECTNNSTITGKEMTGTYYLWVLLETESGKKNICGSEAFNFDNQGPTASKFTAEKISLNGFKVEYSILDDFNKLQRVDVFIDGSFECSLSECNNLSSFEGYYTKESLTTGSHSVKLIMYDELGNSSEIEKTFTTKLYAWESYNFTTTSVITPPSSFYETVDNSRTYKYSTEELKEGAYFFTGYPNYKYNHITKVVEVYNGDFVNITKWGDVMTTWLSGKYQYMMKADELDCIGVVHAYSNLRTGTASGDPCIRFTSNALSVGWSNEYTSTTSKGTFLTSENPNAWPDDGYKDGYYTKRSDPR